MPILLLHAAALAAALLPALASAAPLTLQQALKLAVQRSEAARAARAGITSASQSARAAGELPDPTLRAGVDNLPVTGGDRLTTRDFMTMKRIGLSQEYVSPAKRAARRAAADAVVQQETVRTELAAADTRLQTALAYFDAYYATEALQLTTLMEHHAHEEFEASRARLSTSTGSSQEVLAMAGARGVAADESDEVRQQQSAARVALQRWTGVEAEDLAPLPPLALPGEPAYVAAHPSVAVLQRDVEVARQTAAATDSQRRPNWTWEVSYGQRSGYSDMVSLGVSIPLQVAPAERQDRETAAKLALVDKAEAQLAEAIRDATAEYRALASDAQRLAGRIERYRSTVVTSAEQRTAAAMAAYRSNQTPLMTLFEARHAEVEVRRKFVALQRDLAKTQARLAYKPLSMGEAR
jgi:cobalt-zinc-cadmium efflux system outer membrane protein